MKQMQKLTCLLLAMLMVLSLGITVFAAEGGTALGQGPATFVDPNTGKEVANGNGKITITNAIPEEKYDLYQILYLDDYGLPQNPVPNQTTGNVEGGNYAYKFNSQWTGFIDYAAEINGIERKVSNALSVDEHGYVTWVGDTSDKTRAGFLAILAKKYADKEGITPLATVTASKVEGQDRSSVEFNNLNLGYYLVDSSVGVLCSLNTTNPTTNMQEKNSVPENEKNVKEETWGTENDAGIGDTVHFRSKITLATGIDHLIFHDTMTEGLSLVSGTIKVFNDAEGTQPIANDGNASYVVDETPGKKDEETTDCTFHVEFQSAFLNKINSQTTLYVFYDAVLNEKAKVGGSADKAEQNINTSSLTYGDLNHTTPGKETVTRTWEIPVFKFGLDQNAGNSKVALAGAVFQLKKITATAPLETPAAEDPFADVEPIELIFVKTETVTETVANSDGTTKEETRAYDVYRVAKPDETGTVTEITTGESGRFRIQGLDAGNYELVETKAPNGYNRLTSPIPIEIQHDGKILYNNTEATTVEIQNGTGSKMPSTGGIGTTIFYVVGSVLLVGAGVLLITKKRMSAEA